MSKRGKRARALRKQQQKTQKILKRLRQAGVKIDTDYTQEREHNKPKNTALPRGVNHNLKEGTNSKTNNLIPTQQNLHRAVQAKRTNLSKRLPKQFSVNIPTGSEEKETQKAINNLRNKLREADKLIPPQPEQPHEDKVNTDTSFFVDSVINSWLDEIHHFPKMAEPLLKQWYNSLLGRYTKEDIATMLEEGARAGVVLTYEIAYDGEKLAMYMSDMLDFYPEMTPWEKAEVMEQFESWEDIL